MAAAIANILLENTKKEFALILRLSVSAVVVSYVLSICTDRFKSLFESLVDVTLGSQMLSIMLKSAIICLLFGFVSDVCKESGSLGLSSAVGFAGRILILALCIPLVESVIETALSFIT